MPLEKAPKNPRLPGFVPAGGRPYRVKDTDTWWSVARTAGVDVWDLIDFNFGSRDPREINWYLYHRVGCRKPTPDHKNWAFSSGANPGVIYLPAAPAARAPARGPRPVAAVDLGTLGIRIKGSEDYVARVKWGFEWIARSDSGLALLQLIGKTGKRVTVEPFKPEGGVCTPTNRNAYAAPEDWTNATKSGEWIFNNDDPKTPRDERFDPVRDQSLIRSLLGLPQEPVVGTGKGSDVVVSYSPTMWGYGNQCSATPGQPGSSPSEVLVHELVHGYRQMRGHLHMVPTVGGRRQYDNEEEFFAVVVTNVWVADPTNPNGTRTLRADHWGFTPLPAAQSTTKGFVAQAPNQRSLQKLVREEPELAAALKPVGGPFNPFTTF